MTALITFVGRFKMSREPLIYNLYNWGLGTKDTDTVNGCLMCWTVCVEVEETYFQEDWLNYVTVERRNIGLNFPVHTSLNRVGASNSLSGKFRKYVLKIYLSRYSCLDPNYKGNTLIHTSNTKCWTVSLKSDCKFVTLALLTVEHTHFYSYFCRWCSLSNTPVNTKQKDWLSFQQRSLFLSWYILVQVKLFVMKKSLSAIRTSRNWKMTWKSGIKNVGTMETKGREHRIVKQRKNTIKRGWKCMLRCAFIQVRDLLWEENWGLRVFITHFVLSGLMTICLIVVNMLIQSH